MCPQGKWEKVSNGLWVKSMSPFDHKLLDIRMTSSSTQTLEVSIEEGKFVILLSLLLYFWQLKLFCLPFSFVYLLVLFCLCRIFSISHSIFNIRLSVVELGIYSKPVLSILLW